METKSLFWKNCFLKLLVFQKEGDKQESLGIPKKRAGIHKKESKYGPERSRHCKKGSIGHGRIEFCIV